MLYSSKLILHKFGSIFLVESAWKVFTDTYIPSFRTYLFVHRRGAEGGGRLFTSGENSHAEQKFMENFKEDNKKRYKAGGKKVKLDVYLTHPINCAGLLKAFAEEYSFQLNIVVGACSEMEEERHELVNEEELCDLMASGYCTVRSFRKQDYLNLARYLRFPIIPKATIVKGDKKTEGKLRKVQYSE